VGTVSVRLEVGLDDLEVSSNLEILCDSVNRRVPNQRDPKKLEDYVNRSLMKVKAWVQMAPTVLYWQKYHRITESQNL